MATVKINNKKYEVPDLTFRHLTQMEEQGFSLLEAFRKRELFLIAMGFTCVVTGEDRDEAERLIEQHVMGGGSLESIYEAFGEAVNKSGFFKKFLGLNEMDQTEKKAENKESHAENETTAE